MQACLACVLITVRRRHNQVVSVSASGALQEAETKFATDKPHQLALNFVCQ